MVPVAPAPWVPGTPPAQLMRMSMVPNPSSVPFTISAISALLVMSVLKARALPPIASISAATLLQPS